MRQLKNYRMAVVVSIVGLLVVLPALPLIVFPIWALIVLSRPDVQAAFDYQLQKGSK